MSLYYTYDSNVDSSHHSDSRNGSSWSINPGFTADYIAENWKVGAGAYYRHHTYSRNQSNMNQNDFGQNLSCALMMNWFFVYCTDVLYIEGRTIGIVLGIARIWDAVNDPVMGTFIDRHTFKNGNKFRPFLKITPFIIGIIVVLLFTNWGFQGDMPKAIYVLILYLAYDIIWHMT